MKTMNTSCCSEISKNWPKAQAVIGKHLKAMKEAGFSACDVKGLCACRCADKKADDPEKGKGE
ncbi:MAG: hypothetical protein HZB23_15035 [Deltaproteobacteria bacterium]|nr:hypothetical protein [Deltaproteobacteria bacterium]